VPTKSTARSNFVSRHGIAKIVVQQHLARPVDDDVGFAPTVATDEIYFRFV